MFGILLILSGSFLTEVSSSVGKDQVQQQKQSVYAMGFLQLFCGTIIFLLIVIFKPSVFVFSLSSLPFFLPRVVLEIVQAYATVQAIAIADRSTFNFIRIGTIPLLATVDFFVGYQLDLFKLIGIGIILVALLFIFLNKNIQKAGIGWVVFSTINAAVTLSLYKYDISYFNSIVAEQIIIYIVLLIFFVFSAFWYGRENPFTLLKQRLFLVQSLTNGIGGVLEGFAYGFAPTSVITAAKRSAGTFWAITAGTLYFKEKNFATKLIVGFLLVSGILALVL